MLVINFYIVLMLMLIAYKDYKTSTIPNTYVGLLALGTGLHYVLYGAGLWSFMVAGGIFMLLYLCTNGLGAGDVKLVMALAWWLNYPEIFVFLYGAICLGVMWSVAVALYLRRRKVMIPFGPAICFSGVLTYYYGVELWQWWGEYLCG